MLRKLDVWVDETTFKYWKALLKEHGVRKDSVESADTKGFRLLLRGP